jgi:hypothetical protein
MERERLAVAEQDYELIVPTGSDGSHDPDG